MSDYDGPRTASGIVDFMFRKLRNVHVVSPRLLTTDSAEEDQDQAAVRAQGEQEDQAAISMRRT